MSYKNVSITVCILAWDTILNKGKTGDDANFTIRGVGDGTEYTPGTPNVTEIDAVNLPGVYSVDILAAENNCIVNLVGGKSSTANISIIPTIWTNEINVTGGAGAIEWTYTVTDADTSALLDGVSVWVTSDSAGTTVIASGTTNDSGVVTFYLDAGTVYIWRSKSGYNFTNPDEETVS